MRRCWVPDAYTAVPEAAAVAPISGRSTTWRRAAGIQTAPGSRAIHLSTRIDPRGRLAGISWTIGRKRTWRPALPQLQEQDWSDSKALQLKEVVVRQLRQRPAHFPAALHA